MANPEDLIISGLATIAADCEITISQRDGEKPQKVVSLQKYAQNGDKREITQQDVEEESCDDENVETEQVQQENEGVYYICQVCAKSFDSKEDVDLHIATQECKGMEKEVKEMYECGECKILCTSMNSLASHMMVHKQKVIVVRHGFKEHLTRVGYTCTICHKVLGSKGNLVKHQIIHTGIKPYKCSFCSKEFSLKGNRDKHELIHSDRRAHQCQICLKKFTLKGNLQQHILTHSTVKFFRCYLCDKEFTLKGNLDKHIKRHANGMGLKGIQKVLDKNQPNKRRRIEASDENEPVESSKNVGNFAIKVSKVVGIAYSGRENPGQIPVEEDAVAKEGEMNDYVEGVNIENEKNMQGQKVGDQTEGSENPNADIQNL